MTNRRNFLIAGAAAVGTAAVAKSLVVPAAAQTPAPAPAATPAPSGPFTLPKLPYAFDALEPTIDAKTMELHNTKHHNAFIEALNKAFAGKADYKNPKIDELLLNQKDLPEDLKKPVQNAGGGHANHTMFWTIMMPGGAKQPKADLLKAIDADLGGFDKMKADFEAKGVGQFGSGWVFVTADKAGALKIVSTPNQNSPIMDGSRVVFGNDVWEHAYYLKYNNRRAEYLKNWWAVANWDEISRRYDAIRAGEAII